MSSTLNRELPTESPLAYVCAAIHMQDLTRREGGVCQKQDGVDDFLISPILPMGCKPLRDS